MEKVREKKRKGGEISVSRLWGSFPEMESFYILKKLIKKKEFLFLNIGRSS